MNKLLKIKLGISILAALFATLGIVYSDYYADVANRPDPLAQQKQMAGNFNVGEFTGAAIYQYPFSVPAGRGGLTPSVNLTFNSQNSSPTSLVGYHWDLSLFKIERLNLTGVEKLYNENHFIANTPFESAELVALGAGPYGSYGPKIEGSFANYQYNANNTWTVTAKDGTVYQFGQSAASQIVDPSDASKVHTWYLQDMTDKNGNSITFEYFKEAGQIYPKKINYSGGNHEIRFLPFANEQAGSIRPDAHWGYSRGFRVETNHMVTGIQIYTQGQIRREYEFEQSGIQEFVRQTIKSITETAYDDQGTATQLPPTRFDYSESSISWGPLLESYADMPFIIQHCELGQEGCTDDAKGTSQWDMSGDGIDDFEYYRYNPRPTGSPDPNWQWWSIMRTSLDQEGNWVSNDNGEYLDQNPDAFRPIPGPPMTPRDFNGDGYLDLVRTIYNSNAPNQTYSMIFVNKAGAVDEQISNTIEVAMGSYDNQKPDNGGSLADLNGDNLPDIIQSRSHYHEDLPNYTESATCINQGGNACTRTSLWQAPRELIVDNSDFQYGRQMVVQDCNLDGLADIRYNGSGPIEWINDGQGGFTEYTINSVCHFPMPETHYRRGSDLNGDGLPDAIESYRTITSWGHQDTQNLFVNTGDGYTEIENYSGFPYLFGASNVDQKDFGIRLIDLNGDRLPDLIKNAETWRRITSNNTEIVLTEEARLNTGTRPYFLTTIHPSTGGRIDLEYKTSAEYWHDANTRANPTLPIIIDTVSKVTNDNGLGDQTSTDYFYEDGHFHYNDFSDRGFAGFGIVTKTDAAGNVAKNYYHQSEHSVQRPELGEFEDHISKKGQVYRTETIDSLGEVKVSSTSKWEKRDLGQNRYFPHVIETISQTHD